MALSELWNDIVTIEGTLILHGEGNPPDTVKKLCPSHSNDGFASHFRAYPSSFPEVSMI
jgi:hypothetical protein